jgi:alpha-amylase
MSNYYQQLKEKIQALGNKLTPEVLKIAEQSLQEWLDAYQSEVAKRLPKTQFNGTLMQAFHWYTNDDGTHWNTLKNQVAELAQAGITALWTPPAQKGIGGTYDVGYGVYDLFDLGEFDQKGTIRSKYGTKDEFEALIKTAHDAGMQIYYDVVFNHKMSADYEEEFEATPFDINDRNHPLGEARKIKSWTGFDFAGRGDKYSSMKWHWYHFNSVDYNSYDPDFSAIWLIKDRKFGTKVDLQKGNYDYLMGCNLDINHSEVKGELKYWGEWMLDSIKVDGFRLDAVKHINGDFFIDWLNHLEDHAKRDIFCMGEYWTYNLGTLAWYIGNAGGQISLFDAPLHNNFHQASKSGDCHDMRTILDGTMMKHLPLFAVTLVENHDTQPLQALESVVESWFKPLAYAIILLRAEGYPCIFYADYYGAHYWDRGPDGNEYEIWMDSHKEIIDRLLMARQNFAYGPQYDYFDHQNIIGWTRLGSEEHPGAMAVILSNGLAGEKWMEVGKPNTVFHDLTGYITDTITTNEQGWADFRCNGGSVSVWVEK